jgi:hypothetical protein
MSTANEIDAEGVGIGVVVVNLASGITPSYLQQGVLGELHDSQEITVCELKEPQARSIDGGASTIAWA